MKQIDAINPLNQSILETFPCPTLEEVNEHLKKGKAYLKGNTQDLDERINVVSKFKELLLENLESLASDLTNEVGKPINEARGEIKGAAYRVDYFINHAKENLKGGLVNDDGTTKEILSYDPLGVICHISAWNYPYLIAMNALIPAYIAGNVMFYKPSEHAHDNGKKYK